VLFCPDRDVIGTPFYLMERLRGRIFWSPTLPELAREDRAAIIDGMNEALARLHMADYVAIGLADYGRPGNYFARQIGRWSKQWEGSRTRDNPAIDSSPNGCRPTSRRATRPRSATAIFGSTT
jgi:aminoglycoside phosphotransferase (APT) family kinase protein